MDIAEDIAAGSPEADSHAADPASVPEAGNLVGDSPAVGNHVVVPVAGNPAVGSVAGSLAAVLVADSPVEDNPEAGSLVEGNVEDSPAVGIPEADTRVESVHSADLASDPEVLVAGNLVAAFPEAAILLMTSLVAAFPVEASLVAAFLVEASLVAAFLAVGNVAGSPEATREREDGRRRRGAATQGVCAARRRAEARAEARAVLSWDEAARVCGYKADGRTACSSPPPRRTAWRRATRSRGPARAARSTGSSPWCPCPTRPAACPARSSARSAANRLYF